MRVIRSAHYPQDPAFMDACDRLGLFVIVATPGWQFWGSGPFADRVYDDIRQMVRRDRNHPSVMMWEPILNETHYPADFAKKARDLVHEEYPYKGCYTACDAVSQGNQHYEVLYAHPATGDKHWSIKERKNNKPYFTREFGDNVDTWSAHNSTSRVARHWGEAPMMVQALHYLKTSFPYTTYDTLNAAPAYHSAAVCGIPSTISAATIRIPSTEALWMLSGSPRLPISRLCPSVPGRRTIGWVPALWCTLPTNALPFLRKT